MGRHENDGALTITCAHIYINEDMVDYKLSQKNTAALHVSKIQGIREGKQKGWKDLQNIKEGPGTGPSHTSHGLTGLTGLTCLC
jgi:hypothetical protein